MSEKELSLKISAKTDNSAFKEINDQIEKLSKSANALKDSLRGVQLGKESSSNHPDSVHSNIKKVSTELNQATKEATHFSNALGQTFQKAVTQSKSTVTGFLSALNSGLKQMGFQGYTGTGVYYNQPPPGPGGGGQGGGGGVNWNRTLGGALGAIGSTLSAVGAVGGAASWGMGFAGDYLESEKMSPMRNLVRSQQGYNRLMGMYRDSPLGYMTALMESGNMVASGDGKAFRKMVGTEKTVGNRFQTGAAAINMAEDTSDIRSKQGAGMLGSFFDIVKNVGQAYLGMGGAAAAAGAGIGGSGPASLVAGGNFVNNLAGAGHGVKNLTLQGQNLNLGGIEAIQGSQQAELATLLASTTRGMSMRRFFETGEGTMGLRAAASRAMGGTGAMYGLFGAGGGLGYSMEQSLGIGGAMTGAFGTTMGNRIASGAMRMGNQGFDVQSAGSILGQLGQAGVNGQDIIGKMAEAVRLGMGKLDIQFFQKIGEAVADKSVGAQGAVGGITAGILTPGVGNSLRDVNARIGGLDLFNKTQQSNPFFSSRNLLDAVSAMGPNRAIEEYETLQNADAQSLLALSRSGKKGGLPKDHMLSLLFDSQEEARSVGQSALNARIERLGSALTYGSSKASRFLKEKQGSGTFLSMMQSAMKNKDDGGGEILAQAGAAFKQRFAAEGEGYDTARAMFENIGAMDSKEIDKFFKRKGKAPASVVDKNAQEGIALRTTEKLNDLADYHKTLNQLGTDKEGRSPMARQFQAGRELAVNAEKAGYDAVEMSNKIIQGMGGFADKTFEATRGLAAFVAVLDEAKGVHIYQKLKQFLDQKQSTNKGPK